MDIAILIDKVRQLVAQVRAATTFADYVNAAYAAMALVAEVIKVFPNRPPVAKMFATNVDACDSLTAFCDANAGKAKVDGPFIDSLLAMLLAFIKQLLS